MNETSPQSRQIAVNTLAVVGFIALIGASMWLAVYSTRYVPNIVNRIGSAAVYLGSVFTPGTPPTLTGVSTTTVPAISATSTATSTGTATVPARTEPKKNKPASGGRSDSTYVISGATTTPTLFGFPDLVVTIQGAGYLATTAAGSFVATSTIPADSRPAVKFTIRNAGTNVTGPWRFSATIPTQTAYLFESPYQQPLNPGDSIEYTLGFDQANRGTGQMISVTANFDRAVRESNTDNNSASAQLTILGS